MTSKTLVVISPTYFGYEDRIRNVYNELGFTVHLFDDRPSNSTWSKSMQRLKPSLVERRVSDHYIQIMEKVASLKPNHIIFINPESLTPRIAKSLEQASPTSKISMYFWDSFKNKPVFKVLSKLGFNVSTFDPNNAQEENIHFRPLFYSLKTEPLEKKYGLAFFGTAHSDRYKIVKSLSSHVEDILQKPSFTFFFTQNKLVYFSRSKFIDNVDPMPLKNISTNSLSYEEIIRTAAESEIVLDIHHPNQIGLTMRTLESVGANSKLITTNSEVKKYSFYDPRKICVISRENPTIDSKWLEKEQSAFFYNNISDYSISQWALDIINPRQANVFYIPS